MTFTWTKNTSCIQVQAGMAILDSVGKHIKGVAVAYEQRRQGKGTPPPFGLRQHGNAQ